MSRTLRSFVTFLMGAAIFVVLPLVSWGITDIAGFAGHPARLAYLVLVILLNAFAAIRIPEVGKARANRKTIVERQHRAVIALQLFSIAIVAAGPYCDRREIAAIAGPDLLRVAGLFLYACGFLMMHFAEARLGKQFSVEVTIQEGHALVTDGPYRIIRHPRYLGIILFSIGLSLTFRSWIGLALSGTTLLTLLWRMRDEEAMLRKEFGAEWESYARSTWRLLPYCY